MRTFILCLCIPILLLMGASHGMAQTNLVDKEKLTSAIAYFQAEKYVEALSLFKQLDNEYELHPRFRAYMSVCHYYLWQYDEAIKGFVQVIPQLKGFPPGELAVYYYLLAESYFNLSNYESALTNYHNSVKLSSLKEQGEIYFKISCCQIFLKQIFPASKSMNQAIRLYKLYRNDKARIRQMEHMKQGLDEQVNEMFINGIHLKLWKACFIQGYPI